MIRREEKGDFLLITQHDHAQLAGELAESFGNEFFSLPEPSQSVIRGVSLHDCGWPLHDDRPTLNRDGKPLDVFETPRDIGLSVWAASAERAAAQDPYSGLLVSLHVLSLSVFATTQTEFQHEKWDMDNQPDRFAVTKFQHKEIERQEQLRIRLGLRSDKPVHHAQPREVAQKGEDLLNFNFRMLQAMDTISLAACCTKPPSSQTQDVMPQAGAAPLRLKLTRRENDVLVDPWPFSLEAIELKIPLCRIEGTKFEDEDDFREAYARGSSEILTCRVLPASLA